MIRTLGGGGLAVGLLLLGGCGAGGPAPTVHDTMSKVVAPQAQIVWDVGNKATDDKGDPDPSKLTTSEWIRLGDAARAIKYATLRLANAKDVTVAAEGVKLQDEGGPAAFGAKQVQGFVDKDPAAFRAHARKLVATADDFIAASNAKDAKKLFEASNQLDQVCEACHTQFWYPEPSATK